MLPYLMGNNVLHVLISNIMMLIINLVDSVLEAKYQIKQEFVVVHRILFQREAAVLNAIIQNISILVQNNA